MQYSPCQHSARLVIVVTHVAFCRAHHASGHAASHPARDGKNKALGHHEHDRPSQLRASGL
jgi:hypothetical protein